MVDLPLTSRVTRPNNLPRRLTSFIGREREFAEVQRLLGISSLVTLTGAGGCGKTRLALQSVADLLDAYPDGIWFVDLAPLADAALLAQAIATVLGLRETAGRSLLATVAEYLGGRTLLLVLDNCEHLVADCASLVETLLRSCPSLRVLVTSREVLGVPGEVVWHVPSLTVPDPRQPLTVDRLATSEAVMLLVERARLVDWSYYLLLDPERVLFRRLAVFAGGWTLEAAEGVGSGEGIDQGDVLDLLTGLVDKSLVLAEGQVGEERYRFLETIRQYGTEKLDESGEATRSRDRHRDWYLELAEQAEPELSGPAQLAWLDRLGAAHDNLRAALEWGRETDPARGVQLAGCLWRFWGQRGYLEGALLCLARSRRGDRERASIDLEAARRLFADLGAQRDTAEVEAIFSASGVGSVAQRVGPGLSSRERDVAAAVAEGLTNAQIAARLYIAEHTVAHHVGAILDKLGVNSRAQIAAFVARTEAVGEENPRNPLG